MAEGRLDDIRPCLHCNEGCAGNLDHDWRVGCDINPAVGHEVEYAFREAVRRKKVVVVGGGPAGMEAAIVAASRGHRVILFEKSDQLGGLLNYAGAPDFKDDIRRYRRYLVGQLKKHWVETRLGQEATSAVVQEYEPDVVIAATGAIAKASTIPAAADAEVLEALEVLGGSIPDGQSGVVIGGGRVGVEVARYLAEMGKKITIVEMLPDWACDTAGVNKVEMTEALEALGVPVLTNTVAKTISADGVEVATNGEAKVLAADFVVTALGFSPDLSLTRELEEIVPEVHAIGDLNGGTRIWGATHDAWRVARTI